MDNGNMEMLMDNGNAKKERKSNAVLDFDFAGILSEVEKIIIAANKDGNDTLSKPEIMRAVNDLEQKYGQPFPQEIKKLFDVFPENETIPLAAVSEFARKAKENLPLVQERVAEIMQKIDLLPQTPEAGQNIDSVLQKISATLHFADDGKGLTAFANDGVLKGKEIDNVLARLNRPEHANDTIAMALKGSLEYARSHGEKVNINDELARASRGFNSMDKDHDGALTPVELQVLNSSRGNSLA